MSQPFLTDYDLHRLRTGRHVHADHKLGAHRLRSYGVDGVHFAVMAPHAAAVSVVGDFNAWREDADPMERVPDAGVWQRFVPHASHGSLYKFRVRTPDGATLPDRADPFAFAAEVTPGTASVVWDSSYVWQDHAWIQNRGAIPTSNAPISICEIRLETWRHRASEHHGRLPTGGELGTAVAESVTTLGFTHVELLPTTDEQLNATPEPQGCGYFTPDPRFGTPDDFRAFVDALHQAGIGVILVWLPGSFVTTTHGLARFDGSCLYEPPDALGEPAPLTSERTTVFDHSRPEVQSFLISSARFWLEGFHLDGLLMDGIESMLFPDDAPRTSDPPPPEGPSPGNLPAIAFLQALTTCLSAQSPDTFVIAGDVAATPGVSASVEDGGLGFDLVWNRGWTQDILECVRQEPLQRQAVLEDMRRGIGYAFTERFVLPMSHRDLVPTLDAVLARLPGDAWQRRANLRLLYGYMFGYPGKKLLFLGDDLGPPTTREATREPGDADDPAHHGLHRWIGDLNRCYQADRRLHHGDGHREGFAWSARTGPTSDVLTFFRQSTPGERPLLFVCNFTPFDRRDYRVGVPRGGQWRELLNSDAARYGGHDLGNFGGVLADTVPSDGRDYSLVLTVPALSVLVFG